MQYEKRFSLTKTSYTLQFGVEIRGLYFLLLTNCIMCFLCVYSASYLNQNVFETLVIIESAGGSLCILYFLLFQVKGLKVKFFDLLIFMILILSTNKHLLNWIFLFKWYGNSSISLSLYDCLFTVFIFFLYFSLERFYYAKVWLYKINTSVVLVLKEYMLVNFLFIACAFVYLQYLHFVRFYCAIEDCIQSLSSSSLQRSFCTQFTG